jgi:hypothetical protein
MRAGQAVGVVLSIALGGCASTPDVAVKYHFPTASTQILLTQSITCDGQRIISSAAVTPPTPTYFADPKRWASLNYKRIDGLIADSDLTVGLTDDGRLKSINAVTTGSGGVFVKNLMGLAGAVIAHRAAGLAPSHTTRKTRDFKKACAAIQAQTTAQKPATLMYSLLLPLTKPVAAQPFVVDPNSRLLHHELADAEFEWVFKAALAHSPGNQQATYAAKPAAVKCADPPAADDGALLVLNETAVATLTVSGPNSSFAADEVLWKGEFPVPLDSCYLLPIPKAKLFGKQTLIMDLSAYGSIQKLQYAKVAGTNEAVEAATNLTKTLAPSASDQAALINAQIGLIQAQQRLAACLAKPAECK